MMENRRRTIFAKPQHPIPPPLRLPMKPTLNLDPNLYLTIYIHFFFQKKSRTPPNEKKITHIYGILQVSTKKQLEKMRIDPKFVKLTPPDIMKMFKNNVE